MSTPTLSPSGPRTAIYWHQDLPLHDSESGHGFMVQGRLAAVMQSVDQLIGTVQVEPTPVTKETLELAVSPEHWQFLADNAPAEPGNRYVIDNDTALNCHTLRTIQLSAGAVINAVDAILAGTYANAFCPVYGGHHAGPRRSLGFCFINNIAIAAKYAASKGARVAIADFDTHSGNGTVWTVRDVDEILFTETYQPGFPGKILPEHDQPANIQRKLVQNRKDWYYAWLHYLLPAIAGFKPDIILVSAGFDAHVQDPLGTIGVLDEDYIWLTQDLAKITPRIVSSLEGGYSLPALARCAKAHVSQLVTAAQQGARNGRE